MERLLDMLSYCRPNGSRAEKKFIARFIRPLGCYRDGAGNYIKRIGTARVMWSCHLDTVHKIGGKQSLAVERDVITAIRSSCLGADDTAGVWLMVNMIERGVEGLYVFHRAEEVGGLGSSYIAKHRPELVKDIDFAIALDRKGTTSIVTHQWLGRSCSDSFALALGEMLGLGMRPDDTGTFTDTANYTDIIPECTNLSVGYYNQHSPNESLDFDYLNRLLERICLVNTAQLPVTRVAGSYDTDGDDYLNKHSVEPDGWPSNDNQVPFGYGLDEYEKLRDVLRYHPDGVVDFLIGYGVTATEILQHIGLEGETETRRHQLS